MAACCNEDFGGQVGIPSKALFLKLVTFAGILIEVKEVQLLKAESPI